MANNTEVSSTDSPLSWIGSNIPLHGAMVPPAERYTHSTNDADGLAPNSSRTKVSASSTRFTSSQAYTNHSNTLAILPTVSQALLGGGAPVVVSISAPPQGSWCDARIVAPGGPG